MPHARSCHGTNKMIVAYRMDTLTDLGKGLGKVEASLTSHCWENGLRSLLQVSIT